MGRKGKELRPDEKRIDINIFESKNSMTKISQLLQRSHITVSTFIIRYLLRGEIESHRKSGRPKINYAPGRQEKLIKVNRRDTLADTTVKSIQKQYKSSCQKKLTVSFTRKWF